MTTKIYTTKNSDSQIRDVKKVLKDVPYKKLKGKEYCDIEYLQDLRGAGIIKSYEYIYENFRPIKFKIDFGYEIGEHTNER